MRTAPMELRLGDIRFRLVQGDICDRDADAIVNAANNELWMGGGVAGAIKRRGGQEIEQQAMAQGPIAIGESAVTAGGKLRARYVIHAAVMGQELVTNASLIRKATLSALGKADELGLKIISFPALGTGVGGFPIGDCARIMRKAVSDHAGAGTRIEVVELVLFGREAYEEAARALSERA
ncbi:MAG: macro domain-containing protein [Armatimonadota bacterium]